jgi:hypothetical protein
MAEPFQALVPIDTGLVAPVALPDLSPPQLGALAAEIARDIRDLDSILTDYKLTLEQYNYLKYNPFFKKILEIAIIDWNSSNSVHKRLQIEAATYLEQGMPVMGARMLNEREDLKDVVETAKMFAKVAGIGEDKSSVGTGEKFTINIDLSGDKSIRIEKNITPPKEADSSTEMEQLSAGETHTSAV